jgi:hypothetical protein
MPNKLHELKENILNYLLESEKNVNDFDNEKLMRTLIHEKVHLYQKKYTRI